MRDDRKLIGVVVRQDQHRKLTDAARSVGKTRSGLVQDLLDRHFSVVPDAYSKTDDLNRPK